jgi:diadenosine tetraphosphate (Ap4A) HIT family hydrolase
MSCFGCDRIALIRERRNPDFVAELPESFVTLADEQVYRGYCIVLLKDHHEALTAMPYEKQMRLFEDVMRVAGAIERVLQPERINYACLCNWLRHVHWHVTPRYADDPEPQHPIWVRPLAERKLVLPAGERHELIAQLRAALG